jgi:Zn-dependent peptidase ImmA (M78 family)
MSDLSEKEATAIANMLLMPEDKVRELANKGLTIEEMASEFYVDVPHMTLRFLEIFPNALIV